MFGSIGSEIFKIFGIQSRIVENEISSQQESMWMMGIAHVGWV